VKRTVSRTVATVFVLASLVFAQLAMSAFACVGPEMAPAVQAMDMPGCDMAPAERSQDPLCQAHCLQGDAPVQQLAVSMPALCGEAILSPTRATPSAALPPPDWRGSLLERPKGPPLAVLHCRFLI
jgi:hypothetical protein